MKKFFSRFKAPMVALIAFVAVTWLCFPYLFSNEMWKPTAQIQVKDKGWTTELVGTGNDFPDTKIVSYVVDAQGQRINVVSYQDIVDETDIKKGKTYYVYALRDGKNCLSRQSLLQDYSLRWKYLWTCDEAPIRMTIVILMFLSFWGTLFMAFDKNKQI